MLPRMESLNGTPSSAYLPANTSGTDDPAQNNHENNVTSHSAETTSVDEADNLDNRKPTLAPDVVDGTCLSFSSTSPCLSLEKTNSLASIKEDTDIDAHDGKGTPTSHHHEIHRGSSSSESEAYLEFNSQTSECHPFEGSIGGTSPTSCAGALDTDQSRERENGSDTCTITKNISQESIELAATLGSEILDDATATAMDLLQKLKNDKESTRESKHQHRELCSSSGTPNSNEILVTAAVKMVNDVEDKREEYDYTPDFEDSQGDEQSMSDPQNNVELCEARLGDVEETLEENKTVEDSGGDILDPSETVVSAGSKNTLDVVDSAGQNSISYTGNSLNIQEGQQSNATEEGTAIELNQTVRSKSLENFTEESIEESGTVTDLGNHTEDQVRKDSISYAVDSASSSGRNESPMDKQDTSRSVSLGNISGQTLENNETEDAIQYYGMQENGVGDEIIQKLADSGEMDNSGNLASGDVFGSTVEIDGAFSLEEHLDDRVSAEERQTSANPSPSLENFVNAALEDQENYLAIEHQGVINENEEDPPVCRSNGNSDEMETRSPVKPLTNGEPLEESDRECGENHQNVKKSFVPNPSEPDGSFEGSAMLFDKEGTEPKSTVSRLSEEEEDKRLVPKPSELDGPIEGGAVTTDKEGTEPKSAVSRLSDEEKDKSLVPKPSEADGSIEGSAVSTKKESDELSSVPKLNAEEEDNSCPLEDNKESNFTLTHDRPQGLHSDQENRGG